MDGKEDLKKVLEQAKRNKSYGVETILFVDEIHRWNKAQQDALLPYVENGDLILIGATTENPSFEIISPLLSRARVFVFKEHTAEDILTALERALIYLNEIFTKDNTVSEISSDQEINPTEATTTAQSDTIIQSLKSESAENLALQTLAEISNGDMRFALNSLELAYNLAKQSKSKTIEAMIKPELTVEIIERAIQKFLRHDKNGEEHYNLISAVHKSLRSSNPTAAVYWIARMLEAGDDPIYVARRLLRFASEDIGNASPTALILANTVFDACHKLGMPECSVHLAQLAEYLARAPKNNSAYLSYNQAKNDVSKYGNLPVPLHFRNAPTKLMKEIGYGSGYEYDHDLENKKSNQECLPPELKDRNYFEKWDLNSELKYQNLKSS